MTIFAILSFIIVQLPIGCFNIQLFTVFDPSVSWYWFTSCITFHWEWLIFNTFQFHCEWLNFWQYLNFNSNISFNQFTRLDDSCSTRVNSIVRFLHISNQKTFCLNYMSVANFDLRNGKNALKSTFWLKNVFFFIFQLTGSPLRSQSTVGAGLADTSHCTT